MPFFVDKEFEQMTYLSDDEYIANAKVLAKKNALFITESIGSASMMFIHLGLDKKYVYYLESAFYALWDDSLDDCIDAVAEEVYGGFTPTCALDMMNLLTDDNNEVKVLEKFFNFSHADEDFSHFDLCDKQGLKRITQKLQSVVLEKISNF